MATTIALKIILLGFKPNSLYSMEAYENSGMLTWILGTLLCGIVYATPIYLLYRVFSKKWNNKVFMILISSFVALMLIFVV
jgi:putative effector of murein hydrolase